MFTGHRSLCMRLTKLNLLNYGKKIIKAGKRNVMPETEVKISRTVSSKRKIYIQALYFR